MSSHAAPPAEADESSLTSLQVQRAREAVEYLSTIPFRGNVQDSGMYHVMHDYLTGTVFTIINKSRYAK